MQGNVAIPLELLGKPLETILSLPGFSSLKNLPCLKAVFTPPVSVDNVAAVGIISVAGTSPPLCVSHLHANFAVPLRIKLLSLLTSY
jgi:hypothetical protein